MILFTEITGSILYIRNKRKQKATSEQIVIQLKKKEQYEDLTLCTLEEVATLIETGMLHNNDNNSLFLAILSIRPQKNKLSLTIRGAKKTQTSMKLRKVYQQMTVFSLMVIDQLS